MTNPYAAAYHAAPDGSDEKAAAWTQWAVAELQAERLSCGEAIRYVKTTFGVSISQQTLSQWCLDGKFPSARKTPRKPGLEASWWTFSKFDLLWVILNNLLASDPTAFEGLPLTFEQATAALMKLRDEQQV